MQCNAIVVHVEKRRAQKSSSTTQRHEIHSSSFGNGHRIHMANTLEELNINQLPSNGFDNIESLVIDLHSTGSRVPSSLPRYGTFELEKEIELSTAFKLQGRRREEYTITSTVANEHLEESTGVSSKDLVDRFLFDPSEQCLKPVEGDTMSSVVCSLGQNLKPSTSSWEVSFVVSISLFGLFLFILLIGNLQTYLQPDTLKLEKERRRKSQDAEQWMVQYFLPENLRQRIRRYEHCKWNNIRGLDDENILNQLPNDIKSDIKRHLCLDLFKKVALFERVDENILGAMCDHLKSVIYTENCYIIREGNLAEEIIFITRGSLVSNTTEGGMSAFSRPSFLSPGDICGEQLIGAIGHSRVPISRRTVQALTDVNVFVLNEHDLKSVINKFDLIRSKKFQNRLKYLSSQWRAWATCYVQAAWLQYRKKKTHSRRARLLEILPLAFLPKPEELDHC